MFLQIIGDAGEDVGPVVPQVRVTRTGLVDRVAQEIRGHELRHTHCAGVGALRGERVEYTIAAEQHELLEFLLKEFAARRIVESQGRKRVEYAVTAGDAAEGGFGADDAKQVLRRHVALHRNGIEQLAVLAPEPGARVDAIAGNETRPVFPPRERFFRRPVHGFDDPGLRLGLGEQRKGGGAIEAPGDHAVHEGRDVGALEIKACVARQDVFGGQRGWRSLRVRRGGRGRRGLSIRRRLRA